MNAPLTWPEHGGADALGVPAHDFSTNANACGPCPQAVQALAGMDRRHYPDPAYTDVRAALARRHGVSCGQIVLAASASEFIHRISAHAARSGLRAVALPVHGYGDYARAADVWGLVPGGAGPALSWACEPASPLGGEDAALGAWQQRAGGAGSLRVLDCAYAPLRLQGRARVVPADVWQLWTPNKALGLTGVRAAYAIAPLGAQATAAALQALAPSWPVGADGVALLQAWVQPATQAWLAASLQILRDWKAQQVAMCQRLGWQVLPGSLANYFTARLPQGDRLEMAHLLQALRGHGIKLRDCASFGLPGCVRLGVLAPPAQQALAEAWTAWRPPDNGGHAD